MVKTTTFRSDRPGGVDAFGRAPFARSLASGLIVKKGQSGLVVGIEGPWGSGKTFVVHQIQSVLDEFSPKPILVEFNPWIISGTHPLVEALLEQIAAAIRREAPPALMGRALEAGKELLSYASMLRHAKFSTPLPLPPDVQIAALSAAAVGEVAHTLNKARKKPTSENTYVRQYLESLDIKQKKENVADAISKLRRSVVVVVDDADRLSKEEIRHLIQAIKAIADFNGVSYLIAYDPDVFAQALSNQLEDHRDGSEYLEKVVQIAYPLPLLLPWRMRSFVSDNVKLVLEESSITVDSEEISRFEEAISYAARLCRHPRDVVRLCNRLSLVQPAVGGELNPSEVLVFLVVTMRYPELSKSIRMHPEDFVSSLPGDFERFSAGFYFLQAETKLKEKKDRPTWEKHVPKTDSQYLIGALNFLFPRKEEAHEQDGGNGLLRIKSWDRLYRLLAFSRAEGVPEVTEIQTLMNDRVRLKAAFQSDAADSSELLHWVEKYLPKVKIKKVKDVILAFGEMSHSLDVDNPKSMHMSASIGDILVALVRAQSEGEGKEKFVEQVLKDASLSVSETVVLQAAMDLDKWPVRKTGVTKSKQLIPNGAAVDDLIRKWCTTVQGAANKGTLENEAQLGSVLWRWAQLGGDIDVVRREVKKLCSTSSGLKRFAVPSSLNSNFPIEFGAFDLIWDRNEFLSLIQHDQGIAASCSILIERLESNEVIKYFEARKVVDL